MLSPVEAVKILNDVFSMFDDIAEKHRVEKIKTIGDAYMCVGGLPVPDRYSTLNVVLAALDMQRFLMKLQTEKPGYHLFNLRIGIHTGPVIAGVVGKKKFAYDIWGDTVNTAARMESASEAGKVNISEATYEIIKNDFECSHRGKFLAKGKGEMDMYYVEKEKEQKLMRD